VRRHTSQCLCVQVGYGSLTYPYGIVKTVGVQAPPKLSECIIYVERGNSGLSPYGQANCKASCWRSGV